LHYGKLTIARNDSQVLIAAARTKRAFALRLAPAQRCSRTTAMTEDDESALDDEVSDAALEAAGAALGGVPTLMHASYCFTCVAEGPTPIAR